MDIQMPVLDGKEATRVIRSLPAPEGSIPIVAVTADVMPHQIAELASLGISMHVGKPFTIAQLDHAVQAAVALDVRPAHTGLSGATSR
jgi:CheY-like chemotaxis protein